VNLHLVSGTIINASEGVLNMLSSNGDMSVPARAQQDLVALVKTVFALVHTSRLPAIQKLAGQVASHMSWPVAG
jgi:hypothetical protein